MRGNRAKQVVAAVLLEEGGILNEDLAGLKGVADAEHQLAECGPRLQLEEVGIKHDCGKDGGDEVVLGEDQADEDDGRGETKHPARQHGDLGDSADETALEGGGVTGDDAENLGAVNIDQAVVLFACGPGDDLWDVLLDFLVAVGPGLVLLEVATDLFVRGNLGFHCHLELVVKIDLGRFGRDVWGA